MLKVLEKCQFVKSVYKLEEADMPLLPEIVLAGRSNAGKSSLINALTGRNSLAKVSRKQGKTQAVNYFQVNDMEAKFYLTDLPGYGYSAAGRDKQAEFSSLTDNYLESERPFACILVLLDIRHLPTNMDMAMLQWLDFKGLPYVILLNKADKLSRAEQQKALQAIRRVLPDYAQQQALFIVSSLQKETLEPLLSYIRKIVADCNL